MNKNSLGALVLLNLVLLAALLVVTIAPEPASAQARGRGDYVMIAGAVAGRDDANVIYILETKTLRLATLMFTSRNNKVEPLDGRDLLPDMEGRVQAGGRGR